MTDWTQFFNPSAFGSFAPAMLTPAANPLAQPSGMPLAPAPVSPGGAVRPTPTQMQPLPLPSAAQPRRVPYAGNGGYGGMLG